MNELDFIYIGAFLDEAAKQTLTEYLHNDVDYMELIGAADQVFIDHCTLVHKNHLGKQANIVGGDASKKQRARNLANGLHNMLGHQVNLIVDGIGFSDKACAFRVRGIGALCINDIPHITIGTYGDGKPSDSNKITEWHNIPRKIIKGTIHVVR